MTTNTGLAGQIVSAPRLVIERGRRGMLMPAMASKGFSKFRSRWWAFCEIDRQVRLQRPCTNRSLAVDLEVDPRTVRRYIAFMREDLGAPIEYDPIDERYVLTDATWTMPNVHLTDDELVALAVALPALRAVTPPPFNGGLETLFAKLLDAASASRKAELDMITRSVDVVPTSVASKGSEWVAPVLGAIGNLERIEIDYHALNRGNRNARTVDPYHLRFFGGSWYLVGFDHRTGHFPVFSLARIRSVKALDTRFERQPFSAADFFRHSFGISVGGEPRCVRVRLTGRAAATAGERVWPNGFRYKPAADGSGGVLEGTIANMDDLLFWIGAQRGDAELIDN